MKTLATHPREGNMPPESFRGEYIRWSLTVMAAILLSYGLALLIRGLYQPDISAALDLAARISIRPIGVFHPKPQEKLIFVAIVAMLPFILAACYTVAGRIVAAIPVKTLQQTFPIVLIVTIVAVLALGYAGFAAPNPFAGNPQNAHDAVARTNLHFYFFNTFLQKYYWRYLCIIFPPLLYAFLTPVETAGTARRFASRYARQFMFLWCGILIISSFWINIFRFPYTFENKYDFSAVYYSVVQVYNGTPMLVDNFVNTYGLYPHFIVPFLKLTGLSVLTFSGLMALLVAVSYTMLFRFIDKTINNALLATCCFSSIMFYSHFYFKIVTSYDSIFASQPIRIIFPMLSLLLAHSYLEKRTWRHAGISLIVLSLGIFWNPEFGILTYLSYVLFLIYTELGISGWRTGMKRAGAILLLAPAALLATATGYLLTIKVAYGALPDLLGMFSTLRMFSVIGAGMLDMPLLHPWNLVALVFLLGLLYAMPALLKGDWTPRHSLVFFITVMGIGSFSYYEGRSHNWNLLVTFAYLFLLLALFAESLLLLARKERLLHIPLALIICVLGSSLFQIADSAVPVARLYTESDNRRNNQSEQDLIQADAKFINDHTTAGEKVLILTADHYQALLHDLSQTASIVNPGFIDLFLRSDYERILSFLAGNRGIKVFFSQGTFRPYDLRIMDILTNRYQVIQSNGRVHLLTRK